MAENVKITELDELVSGSLKNDTIFPVVDAGSTQKVSLLTLTEYIDDFFISNSQLDNIDNTSDADKPVSTAQQDALNDKVDKVAGKGLSDENYTSTEKNKLAGIEDGAEVNIPDPLLTKEKIEENQVLNIEEFYQYNLVSRLINDGIINNLGTINIL